MFESCLVMLCDLNSDFMDFDDTDVVVAVFHDNLTTTLQMSRRVLDVRDVNHKITLTRRSECSLLQITVFQF